MNYNDTTWDVIIINYVCRHEPTYLPNTGSGNLQSKSHTSQTTRVLNFLLYVFMRGWTPKNLSQLVTTGANACNEKQSTDSDSRGSVDGSGVGKPLVRGVVDAECKYYASTGQRFLLSKTGGSEREGFVWHETRGQRWSVEWGSRAGPAAVW